MNFINTLAFMTTRKINKMQNFVLLKGGDLKITVPSMKEGKFNVVIYVSSACADPGTFAKRGMRGVQAHLTEKKTLTRVFVVF